MKAAVVLGARRVPIYQSFPEPVAEPGECRIAVAASAMSHLTRAGTQYSAAGSFAFVPGVDATVPLGGDGPELDERLREVFAGGIDVVIDHLWGPSVERLLAAAARAARFVQVGNATGAEAAVPAAALRAKGISLWAAASAA